MNILKNKIGSKYLILAPVIVGFFLRLYNLTHSSIWHDEGYTMWLIRYNFSDIIARTARDVHPPAYYLIAKVWSWIFGSSAFSIRFLSLIFSVGIIYLVYKIVQEIYSEKAAFWSAILVAFSPFMIRFAQEARMYGVVAFFATLAAYFVVKYIKTKNEKYIWLYVPAMIVGMYTQYYAFFVVISLWLIMAVFTPNFWKLHWIKAIREKEGVFNWKWWVANVSLLALYAPWFPIAYKQVTRVSGGYWIQPEWITIRTIPGSILQFVFYDHLDDLYRWSGILGQLSYWLIVIALISIGLLLFFIKDKKRVALSLYIYGFLPMLLVYTVSKLRTPIYQDRYFPFSAIGVLIIWGCTLALVKKDWLRKTLGGAALVAMLIGIYVMHLNVNHQMRQVYEDVKNNSKAGDIYYSESLYTFLDGSYYFGYGNLKFISDSVNGYGETSLFYDQQNQYMITPEKVAQAGNRIWVIGRPGDKLPEGTRLETWNKTKTIEKGTVVAVLYTK